MSKRLPILLCLALSAGLAQAASPGAANPYSGQEFREIKALAAQDIQDYLAGKGMGLAKAAELNGYPGPSHVLSLADKLGLSPAQKESTEALFRSMESHAKEIGRSLVDEERQLDQAFAAKSISRESLARMLQRIGELQAQLRQVHLESHLAQLEILTPGQAAAYMQLRGYSSPDKPAEHAGHRH